MFGVDESMVSGVDCRMLYLFLVTNDGNENCRPDDSWDCVSGIICISGMIAISSGVGFLWFCGGWVLFAFSDSVRFVNLILDSCHCL